MQIAVFDTYVTRPDGRIMHFDILVPNQGKDLATVLQYGHLYLTTKGVPAENLTTRECRFCHIESASATVEQEVLAKGFAIIEMQHCD